MQRELGVVIERDSEGFHVASVPALHGCHTQAGSLDELMKRVQEAISLCLEDAGDEAEPLGLVGVQRISVAA
jgi:predicted RNase H-like HicB family nuclease